MADNNPDIGITATITTEVDLKGVEAADKAVDNLGKTTSGATAGQMEDAEAVSKTITNIGEVAKDTAAAQVEGTEEAIRALLAQDEMLEQIRRQLEAMGTEAAKAYDEQGEKIREIENANKGLIVQAESVKSKNAEVSKAAVKSNQEILASIKWLQSEWAKYAQVVSGLFGALGLVKQAGAEIKAAWDGFNFEQIRAEEAHQASLVQLAGKVKALNAAYNQARTAKEDLAAAQLRQADDDKATSRYAREAQDIEAAGDALIRFYQLQASLNNNKQERTRIELDRQLYKGEISQPEYDRFQADRTVGQNQDQRNNEHAAALADYDRKVTAAAQATQKLIEATQDYERIVRDPRYMDDEAYTKSQVDRANAERELRGAPADAEKGMPEIKGLLSRWTDLQESLSIKESAIAKTVNSGIRDRVVKQIEGIKKEMESVWDNIQKNKGVIATSDAKRKDFEDLTQEQTRSKYPIEIWKLAEKSAEKVKSLEPPVEDLGRVAESARGKIDDLEKVQEGQQDNDNLERRYKLEQIAEEERKRKTEETAAAIKASTDKIESFNTRIKELGDSSSDADEAMRESLINQRDDEVFNRQALQQRQRGETITSRVPGQVEDILSLIDGAGDRGTPYAGGEDVKVKLQALVQMAKDGQIDKKENVQIDRYIQEITSLIRTDGSNDMTRELIPLFSTVKSAFTTARDDIKKARAEIAKMQAELSALMARESSSQS